MAKSKNNATHYTWGDYCDGWRLVDREDLSVIHERMPPGTSEQRHYHSHSRQFFFVLTGQATFEVNGQIEVVSQQEGLEVPPRTRHQIFNRSDTFLEFLVISQPTTAGDRTLDP
jgi:mannose-6-phosphate isomerase-like protein (cupin superfamily)